MRIQNITDDAQAELEELIAAELFDRAGLSEAKAMATAKRISRRILPEYVSALARTLRSD